MESPIAGRTSECLLRFEDLCEQYAEASIADSATHFRIWAANLGAFHPINDTKSADYRLRSAPAVVKNITDVLDELSETLDDVKGIISGSHVDQGLMQGGNGESA